MVRSAGGRYRRRLAQEQHAAAVYRALAAKRTGEDRDILLALARAVVLGLVQRAEAAGHYDTDADATAAMAADERVHALVVAGLAGLLAGALSMAAGEYISVRSQRELLAAATSDLRPATLAALQDQKADELALVFRARGLTPGVRRHPRLTLSGGGRVRACG
jgi:vacuolar iron transporter family protein